MTTTAPIITLIGCGKMGGAMLEGWIAAGLDARFIVIEPSDINIKGAEHFTTIAEAKAPLKDAALIILAIKPQIMPEICNALKPLLSEDTAILSIAAGQTIDNFENYFGSDQPVIRTMPNTPAAIGKGMSVAVANAAASTEQKDLADQLLSCAGRVEWVEDENLMDAVTAVSGSGPAYIFHLIEILAASGEKAGLEKDIATALARQTVIGAAALAEAQSDTPAATLRQNVTSPGGTTAAALEILMNGEWQAIFDRAIEAAKKRSIELRS